MPSSRRSSRPRQSWRAAPTTAPSTGCGASPTRSPSGAPRLRERFAVEELRGVSPEQLRERLAAAGRTSPAFALLSGSRALLATLRPGQEAAVAGPSVLRRLDVAVLHTLILEELLGIDRS